MKATEINLLLECVNQIVYGIKDNADLKTPIQFFDWIRALKTALLGKARCVLLHLCNPLGDALNAQKGVLLDEGHQGVQWASKD